MKKLLIFLLVIGILGGALYGAYRYLDASGQWAVLKEKLYTLVYGSTQSPSDDPTPGPGVDPSPEPEPGPEQPPTKPPTTPSGPGYDEDGRLVDPDEALYALLYSAATSFEEDVDIAHLGYTAAALQEEVSRFFFTHPDLFYVDNGYSIYTAEGDTLVRKIKLRYLTTPAEAQTQLLFYNGVLDTVAAGIPAGASDFDKVLYLHDYLVQNYAYDYEGLAEENATGVSVAVRDAYRFFQGKVGVCQAYMLAMIALCDEVGIPCLPVISDEMSHAWNLVKLDGEWYHIDVTWDDAGGEQSAVYPSYISYKYFLLSGEALYNSGRNAAWLASESTQSDKYDEAVWRETTTPLCKNGTEYFCVVFDLQEKAPLLYRGTPVEMTARAELDAKWYSSPLSYYQQSFASILLWEDVMLVSTAKGFLYYNAETDALSEAADLSLTLGNLQIFGVCGVDADGTVTFVAAADYTGIYTLGSWQIP